MPFTVTYQPDLNIIEYRFQGSLTAKHVHGMAAQIARPAREHNCSSVLADLRDATIGLSVAEVYEIPKIALDILASSGLDIQKYKRAIVVRKDSDVLQFFETVSVNRG